MQKKRVVRIVVVWVTESRIAPNSRLSKARRPVIWAAKSFWLKVALTGSFELCVLKQKRKRTLEIGKEKNCIFFEIVNYRTSIFSFFLNVEKINLC